MRNRWNVAWWLYDDGYDTLRFGTPVRDYDVHLVLAGRCAQIPDIQGSFFTVLHLDTVRSTGGLQEDRVAVRIVPIRQHVVLNGSSRSQFLRVLADLHRAGVLIPGVHTDRHRRTVRCLPVVCLVHKSGAARRIIGHVRHLQRLAATRRCHRSDLRLADRSGCQNITIDVRVILQYRQRGGSAWPDTELIINGVRWSVLVLALRVDNFVGVFRRFLFFFFLVDLLVDLIPIIHERHVHVG